MRDGWPEVVVGLHDMRPGNRAVKSVVLDSGNAVELSEALAEAAGLVDQILEEQGGTT